MRDLTVSVFAVALIVHGIAAAVRAQDISVTDPAMTVAINSGSDGSGSAHDDIGIERIASGRIRGGSVVERWHDKQSGVEFVCVHEAGCVLTGRKW